MKTIRINHIIWVLPADSWADATCKISHRAKVRTVRNPILWNVIASILNFYWILNEQI